MTETTGTDLDGALARRRLPALGLRRRLEGLPPSIRLLRPHQWVKNAFVVAPLFFTPAMLGTDSLLRVLAGFSCFCLVASAVYILNDTMDREADRRHPVKRARPIASGAVSVPEALSLFVVCLVGGLAWAALLDPVFAGIAGVYFLVNVAYSSGLKDVSILDVMTITLGFVLRVVGGAQLIGEQPSVWILVCTGLIALFLALAKRRDDLCRALGASHRAALAGYNKPFLDASISVVLGALLVAYIMYTTDDAVAAELRTEQLYLTVPFVVAGILRYLQIALVEERSGAPTMIVLTDRFLIGCMGLWTIAFALLIHLP